MKIDTKYNNAKDAPFSKLRSVVSQNIPHLIANKKSENIKLRIKCTQYSLCDMQLALCSRHYAMCIMEYALCNMYYAKFTMQYAVCNMYYVLCKVHNACNRHYAICIMYNAKCTMQ